MFEDNQDILYLELLGLGAIVSQLDPSVFVWYKKSQLNGWLYTCIDDFLFRGNQHFLNDISLCKYTFTIGVDHCVAFQCVGLAIIQSDNDIIPDQVDYINSLEFIDISNAERS